MVNIKRWLAHSFIPPWRWRMAFPAEILKDIESTIKRSETRHRGELRFAIENALAPSWIWRDLSAHQRAAEIFSNLRVWDTEENSGILIYVLLADREVHIIADRGIARKVAQPEWDSIAKSMQNAFKKGDFRRGSLDGIEQLTLLLANHFPPGTSNPNELINKPVIIKR